MDTQTEFHTPVDTDLSCFEKARANGEETFTLRSQDITAPLVVDFWVKVQQRMRDYVKQGLTPEAAVLAVRNFYFLMPDVPLSDVKLTRACAIAGAMEKWGNRRLAD